jgi:hypothetical protein
MDRNGRNRPGIHKEWWGSKKQNASIVILLSYITTACTVVWNYLVLLFLSVKLDSKALASQLKYKRHLMDLTCILNYRKHHLLFKPCHICNRKGYYKPIVSSNFSKLSCKFASVGGHPAYVFSYTELKPYMLPHDENQLDISQNVFRYVDHVDDIGLLQYPPSQFVHINMPLQKLATHLTVTTLKKIAKSHGCSHASCETKKNLQNILNRHSCPRCNVLVTVFSIETPKLKTSKE